MPTLELDDIQGIIVRGYGALEAAAFVVLEIRQPEATRRWLGGLAGEIRDGVEKPFDSCVNLAFTHSGLAALDLDDECLAGFSAEFKDGMAGDEHRRRILGDVGTSAPGSWRWGGPGGSRVDALLLLYAPDQARLEELYTAHRARFEAGGLGEIVRLDTILLPGRKEHFGFRDGIGQPEIAGKEEGPAENAGNTVGAGELLLGYLDEYGALPPTPTVAADRDPAGLLAAHPRETGRRDLGRNGSYLVVRQLHQEVAAFWRTARRAGEALGWNEPEAPTRVAAKMVGRWPSGAPLLLRPDHDDPALADEDGFLYHATDPHGDRCPLGSHVRRTNPRDSLDPDPGSAESLKVGNRHRIMRRGRAYGPPLAPSMAPRDLAAAEPDGAERGLHFLCFNTNLNRQFEFIQHTWVNNPKFAGLYDDADPLIGEHDSEGAGRTGVFTMPGEPLRQRVTGIERFVQVRGGAYFFMPGIRALRYLAALR